MGRSTTKKKQSRLAFTPVTSSPDVHHHTPSSAGQLAHMRFAGPHSSSPILPPRLRLGSPSSSQTIKSDDSHVESAISKWTKPKESSDLGSDDVLLVSPFKRRRLSNPVSGSKVMPKYNIREASDSSDDSIRVISTRPRRLVKKPARVDHHDSGENLEQASQAEKESDSDDIIVTTPAIQRQRRYQMNTTRDSPNAVYQEGSNQEELDIQEDLEDLPKSSILESRTRGNQKSAVKSQRQKQLELLQRRRAQKSSYRPVSNQSSESSESSHVSDALNASGHSFTQEENQDDVNVESETPKNLDEYETDFVIEDDENETIGVPNSMSVLPFEFSRYRSQTTKELFKYVIEWMVQNKINPAFPRNDEVYDAAFKKVNDEVAGLAASQLISPIWTLEFRRALEARPYMHVLTRPPGYFCDACNRKHPASFEIKFDGAPYALDTLEPIYVSDETDSDDSGDKNYGDTNENTSTENLDRDWNPIPSADTQFSVGRHCKNNVEKAHKLIHWRIHLYEWVIYHLEKKDVFTPNKILERSKWSVARRAKYADKIVDTMVKNNDVKRLWKDFNQIIKDARESKTLRFE